jgi:predicted amino acid-binding ACT domain protein
VNEIQALREAVKRVEQTLRRRIFRIKPLPEDHPEVRKVKEVVNKLSEAVEELDERVTQIEESGFEALVDSLRGEKK